jgi:Protein of unknown function (DUF1488)
VWRPDIESLVFIPSRHDGACAIHRRAFQTLLGCRASADACEAYFMAQRRAFEAAAAAKISREALPQGATLHLTSRDIRRHLAPPA